MRQNSLSACIVLFALSTLRAGTEPPASSARSAGGEGKAPRIVAGPCLQNPSEAGVTVVWVTDANCAGWVEFGVNEPLSSKAASTRDGLVDADRRLHRVTLRGLKAGTTYRYRAVSRQIVEFQPYKVTYGETVASKVYSFTTLDPEKGAYSFVVVNDLHENLDTMKRLFALADEEPYDFAFLNGDIVNDPQSEEQVLRGFLQPCAEALGSSKPFVLVRGNHETRGRFARRLKPFVRDPQENYYGAFSHGGVRFVVLDSGEDKADTHDVYAGLVDFDRYREEQRDWLSQEVAGGAFGAARFQVSLTHIPLFGSGDGHGASDCRRKWGPVLDAGGTDLHLSGHLHRHRILEPGAGHDYPVAIGGGPKRGTATLTRVDVTPTDLTVTVLSDGGEPLHSARVKLEDRDRKDLLRGVNRVDAPGSAGPLCVFGDSAIVVAATTARRGGGAPVVAAARFGRGRAVAFGHPDYLAPGLLDAPTGKLVTNAVQWAARRISGARLRVGLRRDGELEAFLGAQGLEVVSLGGDDLRGRLKSCDVVCVNFGRDEWGDKVEALAEFLREGGGVVASGLARDWVAADSAGVSSTGYPGNRLLAPAGIVWADGYAGRSPRWRRNSGRARPSVTPGGSRMLHAGQALTAIQSADGLDPESLRVAGATLARAVNSVPPGDTLFLPRLARLRAEYRDGLVPTAASPISMDSDPLAWLLFRLSVEEAAGTGPEAREAHPAAREFPGRVPVDGARAARTIFVDTEATGWHNYGIYGNPRSPYWHSTGLYAAPGEVISVTLPDGQVNRGLHLRIGAHSDSLSRHSSWKRAPEICRRYPLTSRVTKASNAFGGLVYVEAPYDLRIGKVKVRIENAVEAPHYVLGATTVGDWVSKLRHLPAPWAELETKKVILTLPSEAIRELDDPESLMRFWDDIMDRYARLLGRPTERRRPERFVSDVQISAGYMHSGYPLMTMLDIVPTMVDKERIRTNGHHGVWGLFHEIGHNHQSADWTFAGTTEVTVNLFSLYVMETVCGISADPHPAVRKDAREKNMKRYLAGGADFEDWKRDPFLALAMYIQLKDAFGWETFTKVFSEYRSLAESDRPQSDGEKRDQWLVRFSRAAGRNLASFFETWGVPTSQRARDSLADLPVWMPPGFPPE